MYYLDSDGNGEPPGFAPLFLLCRTRGVESAEDAATAVGVLGGLRVDEDGRGGARGKPDAVDGSDGSMRPIEK